MKLLFMLLKVSLIAIYFMVFPGLQIDIIAVNIRSELEIIKKLNGKERNGTCNSLTHPPDHSAWNDLLQKYVDDDGNVDYQGFKNDIAALDNYLSYLAKNRPEPTSGKDERLAYYINLYNAATVKLVVDNYPLKSIKDLKNPWDRKWVKVGDELFSLGYIEHRILRKMEEPRIHFAINCASYSCPKLLNEAFQASSLKSQLQFAASDFVNDSTRNIIGRDRLQLSNIFKWYKEDFTDSTTLRAYISRFSTEAIESDAKIEYLKYNWNLNEKN